MCLGGVTRLIEFDGKKPKSEQKSESYLPSISDPHLLKKKRKQGLA